MKFCNSKFMDALFDNLHKQNLKRSDLDSTIFCYKNKQYKACALLVFSMIDSQMIKLQSEEKYRLVGLQAIKKINEQISKKFNLENLFVAWLYMDNLTICLETYFARGNNFVKEPGIINRNFIGHGMNMRAVRKRDCIQLFIALDNMMELLKIFAKWKIF